MVSLSNWLKSNSKKKQPYNGLFKPTAFHAKGTASPSVGTTFKCSSTAYVPIQLW